MINVTFRPHKNFPQSWHRHIDVMIKAAAFRAAEVVADKLAAGARTGIKYAKYPRRSSKPGEYPQEQFSNLRASVNVLPETRMFWKVGFFGDDIGKLSKLEYGMAGIPANMPPMNRGYRKGQRKPLFTVFIGRDRKSVV